MAQITLNTKLNSESFTTNDSDIIYLLPLVVNGSTVGSKIIAIDTANVDTQVIDVEESVATVAGLTNALVQVTLSDRSTPYISIARIRDIITVDNLAVIKYDGNGNVFQTLNTSMTVAQVLTAIDAKKNEPKKYIALISQRLIADPTIDVILENTIGNIVWSRNVAGEYVGTLNGAFTADKVICFAGVNSGELSSIQLSSPNVDEVTLLTFNSTNVQSDELLYKTSIEIRVYP
jgi:hypothetical protein